MARFKLNTPGIKKLKAAPAQRTKSLQAAREVAKEARRIAPVDTGHYKRSIRATVYFDDGGWIGRVNAYDFKAYWIEFGTARNAFLKTGMPKYRVLGTALDVVKPAPFGQKFSKAAQGVAKFLEADG